MNYETATDFELNKRLAELQGYEVQGKDEFVLEMERQDIVPVMTRVTCRNKYNPYVQFDYCNNWSDIMPIAVDLKVKIDPRRTSPKLGWMVSIDDQNYSVNQSPQRALVICCIKVLEENNV